MLALRRFHLDTRSWDDTLVPFRNTPFEALFPDQDIAIISVDTDPTIKPSIVYDLSILDGWQIDFASGAKKHGDFFITPAGSPRVASFFWDTAEKAIAYGGNLVTDCESIHHVADLRVLVVNDGEYGTGDCHAKASPQLYALIDGDERRAVQFRLATIEKSTGYLAKGTAIVTTPGGPDLKHDLIIPLSSFKSYTPALGEHTWNAHFGVVSFSSYRPTRVSYTIIQWLSHETIETEIMPGAAILADQLLLAGSDTQSAIQFFKLVAPAGYDPEENILFNILRNDNHSRLTHHPYVVTRLKRLLRRRWLHLALGGGLRWAGLQAIPCDDIPDDQICIPQLPEGQIISTRYPVRSWADLKLWTNKHTHKGHKGVVWMNHTTALTVGGDFDGDYFLFATADDFPMIAAEIRIWQMTRSMQPIEKIKQRRATPMTSESMATVAMDNCDNMVGLLTYFVAQACAAGRLDFVASLAPEIQIAVDKFKYDLQHDEALIDDIATQLIKVEWLSNKKDSRVYLTMPLPSNGTDVISKLVTFINDLWEPPKLLTAPLAEFAHIFPNPGTPSRRMCPPQKRQIRTLSTICSCPTITLAISLRSESNILRNS